MIWRRLSDAGTAVCSQPDHACRGFLTEWLETIEPRIRETTWVSYRMAVKRITRQIGAVQLQSLTPLQVEALYATLLGAAAPAGGHWHRRRSATATSSSDGHWPMPSAWVW